MPRRRQSQRGLASRRAPFYAKTSLAEIKALILRLQEEIKRLQEERDRVVRAGEFWPAVLQAIEPTRSKHASAIQQAESSGRKRGLVGFFSPGLTDEAKHTLVQLKRLYGPVECLWSTVWLECHHIRNSRHAIEEQLPRKKRDLHRCMSRRAYLEARDEAARKRKEREEKKRQRVEQTKAIAKQVKSRRRDQAYYVRKKLALFQQTCAYCEEPLSDSPHADHIYPIAKGGLSTFENMVLVCAGCNSAKFDMTLSAFVEKCGLDRQAIEARLRRLGKQY